MRRLARAAVLALALLVATAFTALVTAGVAFAHATRVSADPTEDAVLNSGPAKVSATFNERLQTTFVAMTVVGPDGNLWSTGDPQVQGAVASVGLRPLGPAGTYTVHYRVTSADGHVVAGSWSFRLALAGTGTPGPPAAPANTSTRRVSPWLFAAGVVLLIAGPAWWASRRRS
ncbi:copper resistance CopC family protein [Mycobacterium sp.]|uniref:copper resistance CopC family protein n=1 Tax=Mycobacterium sp. TaxID=1785 RepID=UPI0031D2AD0D